MRLHAIRDHRFTRRPPAALVATACVLAGAILLPMSGVRGTEVMAEPTADGIAEPAVPPAQQAAAESAEKILRYVVDGDMTAPHPIKRVNPRYTEEARLERIQGGVVLETVIDRDGTVTDIKVLRGLPLGLSEAAVEAVREWRFEPSILDGEPAAVRYILTIRFSLDDEEGRRSTALVPSFDHSSPAVTLHFGDRETFPEDTVDRLSRIVDRVRLELPVGVRLTDAGMQGATLGLSGIAGPDGVETSVATFVQRLALLPEIRAVDLKDLRHGDGGLYRFVVEAELDE